MNVLYGNSPVSRGDSNAMLTTGSHTPQTKSASTDDPTIITHFTRPRLAKRRPLLTQVRCQTPGPQSSSSCQTSFRKSGMTVPSRRTPSTFTSGPPIMKSVCTVESLTPSTDAPPSTASV